MFFAVYLVKNIDSLCIQFNLAYQEVVASHTDDLRKWLEGCYEDVKDLPSFEDVGENRYGSCFRECFLNAAGKSSDYFNHPDKVCDAIGHDAWIANVDKPEEIMRLYYISPKTHEMGSLANHAVFNWKPEDLESPLFEKMAEILPRFMKDPPKFKYASPGDFPEVTEEEFKKSWVHPDVKKGKSKKTKAECGSPEMFSPAKRSKR